MTSILRHHEIFGPNPLAIIPANDRLTMRWCPRWAAQCKGLGDGISTVWKNHKEPEANRLSLTSTSVEKSRNEKEWIWTVKMFGMGVTVQVSRVTTPRPYDHTKSKEGFHGCIWRWPTVPLTAFRRGPAECQRVQYFVTASQVLASLQVSQN